MSGDFRPDPRMAGWSPVTDSPMKIQQLPVACVTSRGLVSGEGMDRGRNEQEDMD